MNKNASKIVLSFLFLLSLIVSTPMLGCEDAVLEEPDAGQRAVEVQLQRLSSPHVYPCGLWWSPVSLNAAGARANANPTEPDMVQLAQPSGLSCSAIIYAADAVTASQGGYAVVRYVIAP